MTRTRRWVGAVLAVILVPVAALSLFLVLFDWNLIKPTLNARVSEALARPFAIEGDLDVRWHRDPDEPGWQRWLPGPHLRAEKLLLGNPEWTEGDTFVALERVEVRLALLPLLWKTVQIPRIDLTAPRADLQRLADGRNNWTFDLGPAEDEEAPSSPWTLDIGTIGFDAGQVRYDDQQLKTQVQVEVTPLGAPIAFSELMGTADAKAVAETASVKPQDYAFAWQAKGRYQGQALSGSGKVGGLLALQDAQQPFPLQADLRAGATRVQVVGTLTDPKNLGALDLQLRLSGDSLGNLYPLTGVALPDSPAYATTGRLQADLREPGGARFRYEDFRGRIGESDIQGDLEYLASTPRPKLSGTLVSQQLRMADLGPLIGADSNADKQARGETSRQPAGKVLPVEAFATERWRSMDADVSFTGTRIVHSEKLPFTDLFTRVLLDDGQLSLEPLRFGMAGGQLRSRIRLDGRQAPLVGEARMSARGFKLKQLFPSVEVMQSTLGELNGDAHLNGRGNSVAALLGSADGEVKVLINDGRVSRNLMEIAGLNVGNYLVGRLFGDEEVAINCAAADLVLREGVMTPRVLAIDTENALIGVDGQVDFAREQLDLSVTPDAKGMRIFSLRSPLYVRGTFAEPRAGVQAVPLALRGAGMLALGALVAPAVGLLALVAPSDNQPSQCEPLLKQMRGER
ncbi:MAG: AsmA family protein [Gammaproteobacteria bacterium]|nr:AsmA family protein [Gammaproteobacteria bacterium]MBU1489111.1 AsmA family protein [Gammaproteobacteria bacterium]MBU2066069.1 AsmA family protein [Gammaproteobacteria bacterium]MBU2139971.1 AsmA family protein [Gammaproteobacteria bacterium]MBU2218550.1 AsmA family protein [Gammaproteobacteria bacterium]